MSATACVIWTGNVGNRGYGRVYAGPSRWKLAHRAAYEAARGPIPEGLHLHHTCGISLCVNPDHLQAMTASEHAALHNPPPTHCIHGHEFTPANTYTVRDGSRQCRRCKADRMARYRRASLMEVLS